MGNRKRNTLRTWAGRLHLWLGLLTGLIVFTVAITGCIYVFHDEIQDALNPWRKVEVEDTRYIAPSILREKLKQRYPEATSSFVMYPGKDRPVAIYSSYQSVPYYFYFNPYSGEFLHAQDFRTDFFEIVKAIHMYLLLPEEIGRQVVGISTLIFLLMMLTGIVLWWPKKLKNLRKSLRVKWDARWRRLNYDLHNVGGFYVHLLAVIVAITGLYFSYEWVSDAIYYAGNLGRDVPADKVVEAVDPREPVPGNPIDMAFFETMELRPGEQMYFVWDNGEEHPIETGAYPKSLNFDHQSNLFFHPQTAELLQTQFYADKSTGMKLQEMSYGIHTGQYFDMPGKVIAFILSLFVASLPVTGFMIWWGRKNRMKHLTR